MHLPFFSRFAAGITRTGRTVQFFASFIFLLTAISMPLLSLPALAQITANDGPPENAAELIDPNFIKYFNVTMEFRTDGSAAVTEEITADFSAEARHGIYRNIPLRLPSQTMELKLVGITDQDSRPLKYKLTETGNLFSVRIGNPDQLIQNLTDYIIKYELKYTITEAPEGQTIDWNITGSEWTMPIKNAKVKIILPAPVSKEQIKLDCFTGAFGSTDKLCKLRLENDGSIQGQTVLPLKIYEGFTVRAVLPPHYFDLPEPPPVKEQSTQTGAGQLIEFKFFSFLWNLLLSLP